jgi:CheY-like chemotaxis protein
MSLHPLPSPQPRLALLVDDDENELILTCRALRPLAAFDRIVTVRGGEQAIAYLEGVPPYSDRTSYPLPCLLLLDFRMPRLSGLDVLAWVRKQPRFSALPSVILSGALSPVEWELIRRMDVICCIKSVNLGQTTEALRLAIARALPPEQPTPSLSTAMTPSPANLRAAWENSPEPRRLRT